MRRRAVRATACRAMNWKLCRDGEIDEWGPVRVTRPESLLDGIWEELRRNGGLDGVTRVAPGRYVVHDKR